MPIESILRFSAEQSTEFLRSVMLEAERAVKSVGVETVHDLRVAVRKLRQILKVLKPWIPREESQLLRAEMKELMARAGEVRDRDIAIALMRKIHVPKNRRILAEIHKERGVSAQALQRCIRNFQRRNTAAAWRRALTVGNRTTAPLAAEVAATLFPNMLKDYLRRGARLARKNASPKQLHRFRIATKEIRYTLDIFRAHYSGAIDNFAEKLKKVQTDLGAIHDCTATSSLIEDAKSSGSRKEILRDVEKRRRKKTDRFLQDYHREFENKDAVREWKKALQRP
ncbi:MAG TPA: CHAD domain-containing protein [Bryobacteraceae bacterium]